jgi:hypothetical protein
MQTAKPYGVPVLTDNAAMRDQIRADPNSARFREWGTVPFVIP